MPDDTAKFLSWEYRSTREHKRIYTAAHESNHRNVLKHALNSTTISRGSDELSCKLRELYSQRLLCADRAIIMKSTKRILTLFRLGFS